MEPIKRKFIQAIILSAAFLLASCASETLILKQNYDFTKIKRVAVLPFKDPTYTQSEGTMVSLTLTLLTEPEPISRYRPPPRR